MNSQQLRFSRVLVITDNCDLWRRFKEVADSLNVGAVFTYRFSPNNSSFLDEFRGRTDFLPLNVKENLTYLKDEYDLIISLHCKQIFPAALISAVKCINVHPGLNPYNRGWFPQVFSILNKLPLGATIHEMDEYLDHGSIIDQKEVPVFSWDTSLSAYNRVLEAEIVLIKKNIEAILKGDYVAYPVGSNGNLNLKADFSRLCQLNLNAVSTYGEVLDRLRALSHGDYWNAYFIDESGRKVFVKIELQPEQRP